MPRPHPPEFRQRAVELARLREKPVAQIAEDLGISDSCLRNWMAQADRDEGRRNDGLTAKERESWSSCAVTCGWRGWRSRSSSAASADSTVQCNTWSRMVAGVR